MPPIKICADSTCDLTKEQIEQYQVHIIPIHVTLDDTTYDDDGVQITQKQLYEYTERTGNLPKTSAVSVGEYLDIFEELTADGSEVVYIAFSSALSSSCHNAQMAAEEVSGIHVVDSLNLSTGIALQVLYACDLRDAGKSAQEIADAVTALTPCVDVSFVIDRLDNLHKGGRCSSVAKLGANLLKLKPCIEVKNGTMGMEKKYRGAITAVLPEYVRDRLTNVDDIDLSRIFVTNSFPEDEQDYVQTIVDEVREIAPFREVLTSVAGCTISTHCGPRTLGVLFIRKTPIVKD